MNGKVLALGISILAFCAQLAPAQTTALTTNLVPAVVGMPVGSTNYLKGDVYQVASGSSTVRVWVSVKGTDLVSTNGNYIVWLESASGTGPSGTPALWGSTAGTVTNEFDTAPHNQFRIEVPLTGVSTNVVSDYYDLAGVKYLRVGGQANSSLGNATNVIIRLGHWK